MKNAARGITCIIIFASLFFQVQKLVLPKNHSLLTMDDFYALERNSLDILFIGSSHIVNGIEPQIIEDITGMSTMSCAIIGQQAPLHVDYMEEAVKYQRPSLFVVDIYRFRAKSYDYMPLSDLHESINGMRMGGGIKLKSIWKNTELKNMPEFLFPIIRYHTRWSNLSAEDFEYLFGKRKSSNKGYSGTDAVDPHEAPIANVTQEVTLPQRTEKLLDAVSGIALRDGSDLLFINLPYSHLSNDDMNMYHAIESYMRKRCVSMGVDFEYIDYSQGLEEFDFDYGTDCQDYSHLNNSGARKVSVALAEYISRNYGVNSKLGQE